jgi:cobyrinic acid a,c-diamide synthase
VTLGLVAALRARGLVVQTFKVGPDFLDPTHLRRASGRPCYNLDGWMSGRDHVIRLVDEATTGADIAIIEGVMGLFDGAEATTSAGSSAEIARWLGAPVLLVVNAHGQARSIAPLVKGFATFEEGVHVAAVMANHCGSERHRAWLADSLQASDGPPLIGALARGALPELPSRHLGLVTANAENLSDERLAALGDALAQGVDLDALLKQAGQAVNGFKAPPTRVPPTGVKSQAKLRLGLAWDDAFHFYYEDNLELLSAVGFQLVRFSPLHDRSLPPDLDALYLGGGYPEEHAEALANNPSLLTQLRAFAQSGRAVYAECGGLMALCQAIETRAGQRHTLAGVLPATVRMLPRFKALGYVEATTTCPGPWGPAGTVVRGHEFHYSELLEAPSPDQGWQQSYELCHRRTTKTQYEGYLRDGVLASYVHLHFAAQPEVAHQFLAFCRSRAEADRSVPREAYERGIHGCPNP